MATLQKNVTEFLYHQHISLYRTSFWLWLVSGPLTVFTQLSQPKFIEIQSERNKLTDWSIKLLTMWKVYSFHHCLDLVVLINVVYIKFVTKFTKWMVFLAIIFFHLFLVHKSNPSNKIILTSQRDVDISYLNFRHHNLVLI